MAKKAAAMKGMKGAGFANVAYDSAATFGRIIAFFKMIAGVIIGIVLISIGIYLVTHKAPQSVPLIATIKSATCAVVNTGTDKKPSTTNQCDLMVSYTVGGKEYTTPLTTQGPVQVKGASIDIQYNPENPNDIREKTVSNKSIGIVLILVGIVIMAIAIIWFWITMTYKVAAAAETGMTVAGWAFGSGSSGSNSGNSAINIDL